MTGNDNLPLEVRLAELLARILDEPHVTLPGNDPGDIRDQPTALRLKHFRPELSALAAELCEEAGV